jgi:hypothetical protein
MNVGAGRFELSRRTTLTVVTFVFLVGMAARSVLGLPGGSSSRRSVDPPVRLLDAGPRAFTQGVPTGFAHSRRGAVTASVSYVGLGQAIYDMSPSDRAQALRTMAASSAANAYVAQETAVFDHMRAQASQGSGPLSWRMGVLATRVDAYAADRARVSLWRVGVASVDGLASPFEEWATVTYELEWDRGDWKVWSETVVPGPTPGQATNGMPSTPSEYAAALRGFDRFPEGGR